MTSTPDPAAPSDLGPADPEHDPSASYALDQQMVRELTKRIVSTSGEAAATYTPLTGQALAMIPQSSDADVDQAFARAREAARAWSLTSIEHRQRLLLRLHDLVMQHQAEIMDVIIWETGKARKHAYDEPLHIALTARYYGQRAKKIMGTHKAIGAVPGLTQVEINHVPKGVVGIIAPWNYPFSLALCDGIAAIAAGNAVVIKPDSQTVLTALIGARLLEEAGFPKDLWQTVAGAGSKIGPEMISRADYICFTGSTATGKIIAKGCADRLIGCSLELGGKNPILILRDADINRAVEGAVRATFSNAGQLCVSTERMYVADAIYDRFKEKFVAAVKAMTLRPGLDWGNDMGTLTGPSQLEAVTKHVEDAKAKGATVLAGGRARPDLGPYFYEPTILEGVNPEMKCFGEETFGPVISLYRFTDEADAIARANQGEYGLNGSIYSRDTKRARAMAKRIKCGTVNVNEAFAATFASIDAPMGGMRESGQGRRQGAEGLLRYTETQAVAVQRLLRFGPSFGLNDKKFAGVMTANLKLLKKIGRP